MRGFFVGVLAAFAFASSAFGQQAADPLRIEDVLSAVTIDLRGKGELDRAVLVAGNDGADLYVYFAEDDPSGGRSKRRLALIRKDIAFAGLWGQLPSLADKGGGSLLLKSENSGIGRDRWEQTLTIAWRNETLVVVGLTRSAYDTLNPKAGGSCDLNLATGKGDVSGKPVSFAAAVTKVADWTEDRTVKACPF